MKRAFDLLGAAIGLAFLWPVILGCIAVIRLTSPGPGLFRQIRIGRGGHPFVCLKLRTMRHGTAVVPTHQAQRTDITPFGTVLRRTKLDELPQLLNVLRGDMSLVGPRPCLPTQTVLIGARRQAGVLALRPGITGLAQAAGVDMSDPECLAAIDADYLTRRSLSLDLAIVARTFGALFTRRRT